MFMLCSVISLQRNIRCNVSVVNSIAHKECSCGVRSCIGTVVQRFTDQSVFSCKFDISFCTAVTSNGLFEVHLLEFVYVVLLFFRYFVFVGALKFVRCFETSFTALLSFLLMS